MNKSTRPKKPWWHFLQCNHCKTQSHGEETRQRLLQAAFAEIHRVGFQAASLSAILKDTGLTKGALYHHFPNKLALGYAVIEEILAPYMQQTWIQALEKGSHPIDTIQGILQDTAAQFTEEDVRLGCPINNLAQEMSWVDEGFRHRLEALYHQWRNSLISALEQGKLKQQIRPEINSERLALVIIATLEGCSGMAKNAQSLEQLVQCGHGLIELLETLRLEKNADNEHTSNE